MRARWAVPAARHCSAGSTRSGPGLCGVAFSSLPPQGLVVGAERGIQPAYGPEGRRAYGGEGGGAECRVRVKDLFRDFRSLRGSGRFPSIPPLWLSSHAPFSLGFRAASRPDRPSVAVAVHSGHGDHSPSTTVPGSHLVRRGEVHVQEPHNGPATPGTDRHIGGDRIAGCAVHGTAGRRGPCVRWSGIVHRPGSAVWRRLPGRPLLRHPEGRARGHLSGRDGRLERDHVPPGRRGR
ncbi:hypothetical protein ACFFX0_14860 [Citricoccus parietis]|uniref:Uncharacterized protein n=1 Tax=Citricoccus parietis TaxID=592307 RepID=A0ABV5G0E6_9MICC